MLNNVEDYIRNFTKILAGINVNFGVYEEENSGEYVSLREGIDRAVSSLKCNFLLGSKAKKIIAIGNGGSAAIAIHTFTDYANAGGLKTLDLMNPSLLTCMANDYGYENVFSKPIEIFAERGDMLFAISSSGRSPNIIKAAQTARNKGLIVCTFSGFKLNNALRREGWLNFYVPSAHYGFVELAHQTLMHCILDFFVEEKTKC